MGIAERLHIPPSTDKIYINTLETLDGVFDRLNQRAQIDYLISGNIDDLQLFLHPLRDGVFDRKTMLILGKVLKKELKERIPIDQVSINPGNDGLQTFHFPTFSVRNGQGDSGLTGIIYPTREYAEEIRDIDVLGYELSARAPLARRQDLSSEIEARRIVFPKYQITQSGLRRVYGI